MTILRINLDICKPGCQECETILPGIREGAPIKMQPWAVRENAVMISALIQVCPTRALTVRTE